MKIIVQAFTGGFNTPSLYGARDTEKLISIIEKSGAEAAVIGWNTEAPYAKISAALHELNKEVFLWLPVFSEFGKYAVTAVDYLGGRHGSAISGAADDFTFACPRDPVNINLAAEYYDRYFSGCGFDGVLLDKIRFSTFGNGFRSGFGCFCEKCRDFYESEGVDVDTFMQLMGNEKKDFLLPAALTGMRYSFTNTLIDGLFRARAGLITESVSKVAAMFRQRGIKVGLDVFSPVFAYLSGQDIEALAGCADFVKPMLYRVTDSPAGIPYEAERMKAELLKNGCDIEDKIERLWDVETLTGDNCLKKQLNLLKGAGCGVFPGVEVNKTDFCATSTEYVKKTLQFVEESGIAGCVLSWNVLADLVYP